MSLNQSLRAQAKRFSGAQTARFSGAQAGTVKIVYLGCASVSQNVQFGFMFSSAKTSQNENSSKGWIDLVLLQRSFLGTTVLRNCYCGLVE